MRMARVPAVMLAIPLSLAMVTCARSKPRIAAATEIPEEELADYRPAAELSGNFASVGSDTMNNMMTFWAEGFRKLHPGVYFQIEGKGSATAIIAIIQGSAQLGPMSREPKPAELEKFESTFGYKATILNVALNAQAVYVHGDNPLEEITLEQLDAVFSKGRKRGAGEDVATWGQLGLRGDWADRQINMYGRNAASSTWALFKDVALKGGDFKDAVMEMRGPASIVQAIAKDPFGIGYGGIGYQVTGVRKLRIAEKSGAPFIAAEGSYVSNSTYPLLRFFHVVINKAPDKPVSPLIREFCTYVLSKQGQEVVVRDGYVPVTAAFAKEQLKKLGSEE